MMNEITRLSINISKHEESSINQHNSVIALHAEKYLHILEYSYNLQCLDKKLDYVASSIPCPNSCSYSKYITVGLKDSVKNIDLTEMITNPYLWSYSSHLKDEMTNISSYEWSPFNIIYNNECLLAILNSVGNVEFYAPHCKRWTSICDFSSTITEYLQSESVIPPTPRKHISLNKIKEVVYSVATTAICWPPKLNSDRSCYFVTAQKNGRIYFWRIYKSQESNLNIKCIGKLETGEEEIMSMSWIPSTKNKFLIIYSNMYGQVISCACIIEEGKLTEISSTIIWKYKDRMIPKKINYTFIEERIIVLYSKHRHFVAQMFNDNFELISEAVKNVNDERITTITKSKDNIYIGTVNIKIYKVNLTITNDSIGFNLLQISLKDSYTNHELYGMGFTENAVLCNIVIIDRTVCYRKVQQKLLIICLRVEDFEPEDVLLSNPSKSIFNMWDCIEFIRYKTMKAKQLPALDYASIYREGESNVNKMKIYLIFLKLYQSLESILKNLSHGLLPETSIDVVQNKILAANASSRLREMCEKIKKVNELNAIELESLYGCRMFLNYFCKQYNRTLTDLVSNEVMNTIDLYCANIKFDANYVCQWCENVLEGFSCKNGHVNMFCVLTFTPINNLEYLVCKICNVTAKMELNEFQPKCPYCDLHLDSHSLIY